MKKIVSVLLVVVMVLGNMSVVFANDLPVTDIPQQTEEQPVVTEEQPVVTEVVEPVVPEIVVKDGMTQPVFDYNNAINEEVFVETPLDTDNDGKRDLIKVWIKRPGETALGMKVPVIYEMSPYNGATDGGVPNHKVDHNLVDNEDTSGNAYADIEYSGVLGLPPESREAESVGNANPMSKLSVSWYSFFVPRGYAIVKGCCIGNYYSEGFTNCGGEEETQATIAVIDWLNGRAKAFTDIDGKVEVKADWCTGNVAMTGVSYNGTLPIAAATTGVEGLKTIMPVAAISNWYDYYRGNGAVISPGGYQGEDGDVLAAYCFGRGIDGSPIGASNLLKSQFNVTMEQMKIDQDRETGNYNEFWDARNYLKNADKIKASVLIMHGLGDWNVKTKQFDQFWDALEKNNVPRKLIAHRSGHTSVQSDEGLNFFYNINKWMDHWLYDIDNDVMETMPNVNILNNATMEWEAYDDWSFGQYQRMYFNQGSETNTGKLGFTTAANGTEKFADDYILNMPRPTFPETNMSRTDLTKWRNLMTIGNEDGTVDTDKVIKDRVLYMSDELKTDTKINGTVKVTLDLSADKPRGNITAMLVDYGKDNRTMATRRTGETVTYGGNAGSASLYECYIRPEANYATEYGVVTRGWTDSQNPNPNGQIYLDASETNYIPEYYYQTTAIQPGQNYSYTFEMQPMDYTFKEGHKIGVVVMSSDPEYTTRPLESTEFTLNLGEKSYVDIPFVDKDVSFITGEPEIYTDSFTVAANEEVEVSFNLRNNPGIVSFGMQVLYDKNLLTPVSCTKGDGVSLDNFVYNLDEAGVVKVGNSNIQNIYKDDTLFKIKFKVNENAVDGSVTDINIVVDDLYKRFNQNDPVAVTAKVTPGKINIWNVVLFGDVNNDGKLSPSDASQILTSYIGKTTLTEREKFAADINKDGKVSPVDATMILIRYTTK